MSSPSCCTLLARVHCSDFTLKHKEPKLFARSQFCKYRTAFLVYRLIVSCYLLAWLCLLFSIEIPKVGSRVFIHLSEWTFVAVNCYLLLSAFGSVYFTYKPYPYMRNTECHSPESTDSVISENPSLVQPSPSVNIETKNGTEPAEETEQAITLPVYFKISWALFNINVSACTMVSVIYWTFLFHSGEESGITLAITIHVHLVSTLVILTDLCISAVPMRIFHVIYPSIYGLIYVLFTVIYWALGGVDSSGSPAIYPILDWEDKPLATVGYIGIAGLILVVSHTLAYVVYRLRVVIYDRSCTTSGDQHPNNVEYDRISA